MAQLINEARRMQQLAGINNENNIVITENLYKGLQFYVESVYPKMLAESKNKDILLEGFLTNIINKIKDSVSKDKVLNFFTGIGIALNKITDPNFKELLQNAIKAVSGGGMSKEQIIAAFNKGNIKEVEQNNKGYQIIQKLADFFDVNTKYKVARNLILGLLISAVALKTNQNTINHAFEKGKAETESIAKIKTTTDALEKTTGNYADTLEKGGVKISGVDNSVKDGVAKADVGVKFDYAKGTQLPDQSKQTLDKLADEVTKIVKDGGEVKAKVAGTVSKTTGDVEKAKDTNKKLSAARGETLKKYLEDKLKDKLSPDELKKVQIQLGDATGNLKNQTQENPGGNKNSGGLVHLETKPGETKANLDWKYWPESPQTGVPSGVQTEPGEPQPTPTGGAEETLPTTKPTAPTTPQPQDIKITAAEFAKLNRNGQIATVLSKINPGLDISKKLGQDKIASYTDSNLTATQGDAKKLAALIMNIRKNPDALLKKVAKATGIKLEPRAKAIATKVAPGTQAQLQNIKESSLIYLLEEAMIDQISDEDIKNNQDIVLALLGTMYASAGNTELSIVPKDAAQAQKLKGLGFTPQPGGNYVFLAPGQTKAQALGFDTLQDKNKTQSDIVNVAKTLKTRTTYQSLLKRIDTVNEFTDLILSILNQVDPSLKNDKTKIKSALFSLRNRIPIKEEEKDVTALISNILKDTTFLTLLKKVNTIEEAIQLILRDVIPYLNPNLIKDKVKLKNAIIGAANEYSKQQTTPTKK
jgi:hypothetical protein